jgi:hypothetical protein
MLLPYSDELFELMKKRRKCMVFYFALVLIAIPASSAFCYIDPGTGSLVVQAAIALFLGAGIFIKAKWHWIKELFQKKKDARAARKE